MNATHKKNTTGLIRKWFTRGVACMALLFAAGNVSAVTLTNTASSTWDFNSTTNCFKVKWTDNNNDTAQFNTGNITINVSTNNGAVGAYGLLVTQGGLVFTNHTLLLGVGGIYNQVSVTGGATPLLFSNNLELTASQVWSMSTKRNEMVAAGNLSGAVNLTFDALNYNGRLSLYGSNSLSGTMTVQNAGRLLLDYKVTGQNNSKLDPNKALILSNSADIQWQGGYNFTQAVSGLTISGPGYFYLNRVNSNNVLQVGQITRTGVGSTLLFGNSSNAVTTSSANTNGILGAWATTVSGWVYNTTGVANGSHGNFLGTNDVNSAGWTTTENVSMNAGSVTLAGSKTINTLRLGGTTGFNLGGNMLTLAAGGLMAASASPTLANGFIQSGLDSGELFVYANGVNLTNSATIQDKGATPTVLVTAGANTLVLTGPTTYSGTTYINQGALLLANGANLSTNAINISYNGTLTFNRSDAFSLTNTFTSYGIVQNTGSGKVNLSTANSTFGLPFSRYHTQPVVQNTGSGTLNLNLGGINMFGNIANSGSGALSLTGADSVNTAVQFTVSSGGIILTNASMVVTAGGTTIGSSTTSVGNYLFIAGTNGPNNQTTWDNGGTFNIGTSGANVSSNYVMVGEGGVLTNFVPIFGSYGFTGPDNAVIITNGGRAYGSVTLGSAAGANSNYVYVGGTDSRGNSSKMVLNIQQYIGQLSGTIGNRMTVGRGGVVTNSANTTIANANNSVGNYLLVTDGGQLFNASGTVALGTNNTYNFAQITGNGSVWRNNGALAVGGGATCSSNYVSVTDGALLECTGISVGNASGSGNTVTNNGGILQFTTATPAITIINSAQNNIVIADATISYKGLAVAGRVNLTNNWGNSGIGTNGVVWSGANTLRLDNSAATNSLGWPYIFDTFNPIAPTNYVNLELLGNSAIYGKGVIIGANGSMRLSDAVATISGGVTNFGRIAGSGTISSLVTMAAGSSLSPDGTGTLAFSTNLTFTGTSTYNWNYNASTCSVVSVGGTLTLPATMNLTVNGTGDLPANAALFTWPTGTTAPSTTWTVSPEKYAVRATPTGYVLTIRAGTVITIY